VGGHINPVDGAEDILLAGLTRELEEEVDLTGGWSAEPLGVINDESQPVGSVHFGLVYGIRPEGEVSVREAEQLEGQWTHASRLLEMLSADREAFESWSALILDRIREVL
jgi:predicted NUDIX family phosphoesterase